MLAHNTRGGAEARRVNQHQNAQTMEAYLKEAMQMKYNTDAESQRVDDTEE